MLTSFSAPTAPRHLRVTPLDPHSVRAEWQAPRRPNGRLSDIRYVITYQERSSADVSSDNVIKSVTVSGSSAGGGGTGGGGGGGATGAGLFYDWIVTDLNDDTSYLFQVLTFLLSSASF